MLTVSLEGGEKFSSRFEDAELDAVVNEYGREGGVSVLVEKVLHENGVQKNDTEPITFAFNFEEIPTVSSTISDWFARVRGSYLIRRIEHEVRSVIG